MNRLISATTVGAILTLSLTSASVGNSGMNQVEMIASCADRAASLAPFDMTGRIGDDAAVCDAYALGSAMQLMRSVAVHWDGACLAARGWTLDSATGQPTPLADVDYSPMLVASCASTAPTQHQCEEMRDGLTSGVRTYSPAVAATLTKLGCGATVLGDSSLAGVDGQAKR